MTSMTTSVSAARMLVFCATLPMSSLINVTLDFGAPGIRGATPLVYRAPTAIIRRSTRRPVGTFALS